MEFTDNEKSKLSARTRDRLEKAIKAIVEWSFGVRPMVNRTDDETRRREKICLDFWRRQVSQGIETSVAAQNLPTALIAAIDHEGDGAMVKSILEPAFATGMYPSARDQQRIVQPELALSALATRGGLKG